MNTAAAAADLSFYDKYRKMYIRAFDRMIENNKKNGIKMLENWKDGESVMKWWLKQEDE